MGITVVSAQGQLRMKIHLSTVNKVKQSETCASPKIDYNSYSTVFQLQCTIQHSA